MYVYIYVYMYICIYTYIYIWLSISYKSLPPYTPSHTLLCAEKTC